ncbi:hypothetical protein MBLNU457_3810t2 [Dothideomycetes sp. NU457]
MADMNSASYFTDVQACQNCLATTLTPCGSERSQYDDGIMHWLESVNGEETPMFPVTTMPFDYFTMDPGCANTTPFPTFDHNHSSSASPQAHSPSTSKGDPKRGTRRQSTHAYAEQRYRKRINEKIEQLNSLVPQHAAVPGDIEDVFADWTTCSKVNKITNATAHISKLWSDYLDLTKENRNLESRINQLQNLEACENCPLFKMAQEIMQGSEQ